MLIPVGEAFGAGHTLPVLRQREYQRRRAQAWSPALSRHPVALLAAGTVPTDAESEENRGDSLEVDLRLLSDSERQEYDRLQSIAAGGIKSWHSSQLGWTWEVRTCWRTFTLLGLWFVWGMYEMFTLALNTPDLPAGSTPAIVWILLGSIPLVIAVLVPIRVRELRAGLASLVPDYLVTLDLQHRKMDVQCPSDDYDSPRTYPVTDGMYNPHLYASRGGRDTYQAMKSLGIDDYATYKNNVVEAD